jgi:benzoyl-CoA reductase/2-hydroxyglutaryl-CoA dehydratase subunit BcrC/BadD/HgdB
MLTLLTMTMFFAMSTDAPDPTAGRTPPDRLPSTMTGTEIKAHNQGLPMTHPYYVKCRKMEVPGSLVKKLRVCHTNEQWTQVWTQGNQNSRDIMEDYSSKAGDCRAQEMC